MAVKWSKNMTPLKKYEYRKEHRAPKRKQPIPVDMGSAILRLKREWRIEHKRGNSVVPINGGVELYIHPRAGLVIRKRGRTGPRVTSHVAKALVECRGQADFIGCVTSKVPSFMPPTWRRHEELLGIKRSTTKTETATE